MASYPTKALISVDFPAPVDPITNTRFFLLLFVLLAAVSLDVVVNEAFDDVVEIGGVLGSVLALVGLVLSMV